MMSLVTYYDHSDSETEESNDRNSYRIHLKGIKSSSSVVNKISLSISQEETKPTITKKLDGGLPKKDESKRRIKVNVSPVAKYQSDSDSDSDNQIKRSRSSFKQQLQTSELLALLPEPKTKTPSNTSLIPNIVKKNKIAKSQKGPPHHPSDIDTKISREDDSDSDEDSDTEILETFDDHTWLKVCGRQTPLRSSKATLGELNSPLPINLAPPIQKPYDGLDNQAFRRLVADKRKLKGNIELIDVYEDEIRSSDQMYLKSLTDPNFEPNFDGQSPINNTCKVKNHITSLAQKALANDNELQMRWSENRHNRRLTQAKYGF